MHTPKKILVMKLRAMGDTVLMTAALEQLHKRFPQAEIHVAVTHTWAPLLESHPAIKKIWPYEHHSSPTARGRSLARLALTLRKERFDWGVNLHASPSSATLMFAIGAKVRSIHFHGHQHKNQFSTVEIAGKGMSKPIIERDMDAIRALGIPCPEGLLPHIYSSTQEIEQVRRRLDAFGLKYPILCLGLGASRPTKIWPLDRFAAIAIRWTEQYKGSVICLAARSEEKIVKEFFHAVDSKTTQWYADRETRNERRKQIISQIEIPLREVSAIFKLSKLFVGADSGPKHLAVASGLPTITLFGPEDPFEWHPYPHSQHPIHFIDGLACRKDQDPGQRPWCGLHTCIVEEHRCMKGIGEDEVFSSMEKLFPVPT